MILKTIEHINSEIENCNLRLHLIQLQSQILNQQFNEIKKNLELLQKEKEVAEEPSVSFGKDDAQ